MKTRQIKKLFPGDEVLWTNPDTNLASVIKILNIKVEDGWVHFDGVDSSENYKKITAKPRELS